MNRLLKFREILPKLQFCDIPFGKIKCTRITKISSSRSFMTRTSENMELKLKSRDGIPREYTIVYRGGMDNYIHICHWGSLILGSLGVASLYQAFTQDPPLQFPIVTNYTSMVGLQNYSQLLIMYAAFFAMIAAMRLISVRYILRMYYSEKSKTYKAVTVGNLPTLTSSVDFKAKTLKRITKKSLVPWWNMQYKCNGKKMLLFDHGFRTNADYDRMFKD